MIPHPTSAATTESLAKFFDQHPTLVSQLRAYDPCKLIPIIGGLLSNSDWQASTLRLEVLQHFAVAMADGDQKPKRHHFLDWLTELGAGYVGQLEDPSEHLFVSRVHFHRRDYLIFNGIFDAPGFHLQNFLGVLESMDEDAPMGALGRAARALLRLSNAVAVRAGLNAFHVGQTIPIEQVKNGDLRDLRGLARRVTFTEEEVASLGVALEDLAAFVFDPSLRKTMAGEVRNCTTLERFPLLRTDAGIHLALPPAVSMAIRRMIVESAVSSGASAALFSVYRQQSLAVFLKTPWLTQCKPMRMQRSEDARPFVTNGVWLFDEGRILHLCFIMDDFEAYEQTGTFAAHPDTQRALCAINESIKFVRKEFETQPEFKQGLTLLVSCGWGRPVVVAYDSPCDGRWSVELITGEDLQTLSWDPNSSPTLLWNCLDIRERLRVNGVELLNASGLLNLLVWCERWCDEFIARPDIPTRGSAEGHLKVQIPQNGLLWIRKRALEAWDQHYACAWDGRRLAVQREMPSWTLGELPPEPLYVCTEDLESRGLLALVETALHSWWAWVETPRMDDPAAHYRLWHTVALWLIRAAPILEKSLPVLPDGTLTWVLRFEDSEYGRAGIRATKEEYLRSMIEVTVQGNAVHVALQAGFLASFDNPVNTGEMLLVESLVIGSLELSKAAHDVEAIRDLVRQIVPDSWARNLHVLTGRHFRDFFVPTISAPALATPSDETIIRIGLGWRAGGRECARVIKGIDACCAFLGRVIDNLWEEVAALLKALERNELLAILIENYESAKIESDKWSRSSRAILSLSENKGQAAGISARRVAEISAGLFSCRVLMEMAICESPVGRGFKAGSLDISRLMAIVLRMSQLGGMSDAIRYGAQEAKLEISPMGYVATGSNFNQQVALPFEVSLMMRQFFQGVNSYESFFENRSIQASVAGAFDSTFWEAWTEHFGFSVDHFRVFMDGLETEGIKRQAISFTSSVAEICEFEDIADLPADVVSRIVAVLALIPRDTWASTPNGYRRKDWYPWRYRRRLSVLSLPIPQIEGGTEPRYLLAPGLIRDGGAKLVDYCYTAGFEAQAFPPGKLRSWIGAGEHRRGHQFNAEVSHRLTELAWNCKPNLRLTKILNTKLDRDYGDVDVLAWRDGRVLVIECKSLRMAVTVSDIARQLYDFRGELTSEGKPDHLKKHLLRTRLLTSQLDQVKRFIHSEISIEVQGVLVFSDLVPLHFSDIVSKHSVRLVSYENLETL